MINLARQLLGSLELSTSLQHSVLRYHASSVNYLNLLRGSRLTLKLYLLETTQGQWLVNPHSHRYHFDQWLLSGEIENQIFKPGWGPYDHALFDVYREMQLADITTLHLNEWHRYRKGGTWSMRPEQIHTLIVHQPSVLLTAQYEDVREHNELYMPVGTKPDLTGLYVKPTLEQMQELVLTFRQHGL